MRDVATEQDIRSVVDAFYHEIERDPVLGRFFEALDLANHLPKMYAFWSSIVLQTGSYRGRPFDAHARLDGLERRHFERWLGRFCETVDARFEGEAAERMKARAHQIATIFQMKLGLLDVLNTP